MGCQWIAYNSVSMAHHLTLEITRTATVSAVDVLSNIGGTLGLFCGVSILTLVEVAYWLARALAARVCRPGSKENSA